MSIRDLELTLTRTLADIRSLESKLKLRSLAASGPLETEAAALEKRVAQLRILLSACLFESTRGATEGEALEQSETLRLSACDHFKRNNTDIELWKSIAS